MLPAFAFTAQQPHSSAHLVNLETSLLPVNNSEVQLFLSSHHSSWWAFQAAQIRDYNSRLRKARCIPLVLSDYLILEFAALYWLIYWHFNSIILELYPCAPEVFKNSSCNTSWSCYENMFELRICSKNQQIKPRIVCYSHDTRVC